MGWMIGVIAVLIVSNVWALRVIRRQRRSTARDALTIAQYQQMENLIREEAYKAREATWRRESGLYCGLKDIKYLTTLTLVSKCIDELTFHVTDYRKLWGRYEERCSCQWDDEEAQLRENLEETEREALLLYHDADE